MNLKITVKKWKFVILLIFLSVGFFIRYHKIGEYGLAGDEKYSLFVSQFVSYEGNNQTNSVRKPNNDAFTPKEFWSEKNITDFFDSIARIDTGNGAFYTYTLHYWTKIFGLNDGNLRLLSLIFNLLTIILLYFFVEKHFKSSNLALLAAFLATISPFYIAFSQVARNYSMQFFFSLLSTHFLLLLINELKHNIRPIRLILLYGFTVLITELCHISTFPLFLIHGLFLLIYYRKLSYLISFTIAMIIPLIGMLLWLKSDGGKWLTEYVSNSVKVYNEIAVNNPEEYLKVATIPNIFKQIWHVISCSFINLEGLYLKITGFKNVLLLIVLAIISNISYFKISNYKLKYTIIGLCSLGAYFLPSLWSFENLVLYFNLFLILFLFIQFYRKQTKDSLTIFIILLSILPLIFIAIFAWRDGNTFRIMPRYVGYGYVYGIILMSLIIRYLYRLNDKIKYFFLIGGILQFAVITKIINNIWIDNPPRYFMSFAEPRQPNPYNQIADKIIANYAAGDTVIYCSDKFVTGGQNLPKYSVVDAQLVNFYLPKDSKIIQKVNPNQKDKVFLKKSSSNLVELFDFQGTKYRY